MLFEASEGVLSLAALVCRVLSKSGVDRALRNLFDLILEVD